MIPCYNTTARCTLSWRTTTCSNRHSCSVSFFCELLLYGLIVRSPPCKWIPIYGGEAPLLLSLSLTVCLCLSVYPVSRFPIAPTTVTSAHPLHPTIPHHTITETSCVPQSPTHLTHSLSHIHTHEQLKTESWHGGIYICERRLPLCTQPIRTLLSAAPRNYTQLRYHLARLTYQTGQRLQSENWMFLYQKEEITNRHYGVSGLLLHFKDWYIKSERMQFCTHAKLKKCENQHWRFLIYCYSLSGLPELFLVWSERLPLFTVAIKYPDKKSAHSAVRSFYI